MYHVAVLKSRKNINNKKNWARLFVRKYDKTMYLIKNKMKFKSKKNLFKRRVETYFFFNYIFKN